MRKNRLLESLDQTVGSHLNTRRYSLADMISESYKTVYECDTDSNLRRLAESHLQDVRENPRDIERLSRQLSLIKELKRMTESGEIKDQDLVDKTYYDTVEPKKERVLKRECNESGKYRRPRPTQKTECDVPKKKTEIKEADDPELTDEELDELTKHLETIRKERKNAPKNEMTEETSPRRGIKCSIHKSTESKKSDITESTSYKGLQNFKKQSESKAFYKTFKKMHDSLKEGRALTRKESIDLYKASNSALTQLSIELEHNPEFLDTFKESVSLLSKDVNSLLESLTRGKAPSKKTMKSLAKFSEVLLKESLSLEDVVEDSYNHFVNDLGRIPYADDILYDITDNYEEYEDAEATPESGRQFYNQIRTILREKGLEIKESKKFSNEQRDESSNKGLSEIDNKIRKTIMNIKDLISDYAQSGMFYNSKSGNQRFFSIPISRYADSSDYSRYKEEIITVLPKAEVSNNPDDDEIIVDVRRYYPKVKESLDEEDKLEDEITTDKMYESALDQFRKMIMDDSTLDVMKKIAVDLGIGIDEEPTEKEAETLIKAYHGELPEYMNESEDEEGKVPDEGDFDDFIGDDEGDMQSEEAEAFDQEYADARVELHKKIAADHAEDEDPEVQEKLAQDAEEVVDLPGTTEEQIAEISGEASHEEPADDDTEDKPADPEDDDEITDDELEELKKHLKEMRAAKKSNQ